MPQPFHLLTVDEFAALLDQYPFTRRVNVVHMHHTWRPNHSQDRGHASVVSMWRYHTQTNGWSDIAQHITIDKEGRIWTGRDWNTPPVSAVGHNGNTAIGPFMFEMIGDFDVGKDSFEDPQRDTVLRVIAHVQRRFGLAPDALRFHNEMSSKSCPGSALDKAEVIEAVRAIHKELEDADKAPAFTTAPIEAIEPFGPEMLATHDVLHHLAGRGLRDTDTPRPGPDGDAELPEHNMSREQLFLLFGGEEAATEGTRGGSTSRGRLTPEMLAELRPHLINLTEGQFSDDGRFRTAPGDVDAIFGEHLPAALKRAREIDEPLHVVFYAHGGLVSEGSALEMAYTHVHWWKEHANIYPIYFVWETGLFETLGQMLDGRSRAIAATRGFSDLTDRLIEQALRIGHVGPRVWSAMKQSAALASADGGGAHYAAHGLADFAKRYRKAFNEREIRLHGVGHSAGSIFHAHFVPTALDAGVESFETLHFLAPAIRVDTFLDRLEPRIGDGVNHLSLFTMRKDLELADTCKGVYRKSLLYLIYHALERQTRTPVLGLEENLRADEDLAALFGLGGATSDRAELVLSKTQTISGRRATTATAHGGFDNDAPTMQSVLRRILDAEPGELVAPFPTEFRRSMSEWEPSEPIPPELMEALGGGSSVPPSPVDAGGDAASAVSDALHAVVEAMPAAVPPRPPQPLPTSNPPIVLSTSSRTPRRRALCIGIDDYPAQPLAGCIRDARTWAATLGNLGFETDLLLNEAATREAILARLRAFLGSGEPGDVLAFQFAGHGTFFDDESGDEEDARDEALCPIDLASGAVILDDEIRELFSSLADGVALTSFIDCCHSGSMARLALRPGVDERPRTIRPTPAMRAFHQQLKAERGQSRSTRDAAKAGKRRSVTFAACQDHEVAWESNGQGEFTVRSTAILRDRGLTLTNREFYDAVIERFGPNPRQQPNLDVENELLHRPLLAPLVDATGRTAFSGDGASGSRALVDGLHRAVQEFERALSNL